MSTWPADHQIALDAFYGRHQLRADGRPTAAWESRHLTTIVLPYPMRLSWGDEPTVTRMRCHRLVAGSLKRILQGILDHYGNIEAVRAARMHYSGGAYEFRRVAGTARLSTHAYGAAIDLDPEMNRRGKPWREGMMPEPVITIFENEGWRWGGRFEPTPDSMHFQATS